MLKTELIEEMKSDFSMIVSIFRSLQNKFEQYKELDERIDKQNTSEMIRLKKLIPKNLNQKNLNKSKKSKKEIPIIKKEQLKKPLEIVTPSIELSLNKSDFTEKLPILLKNPSKDLINSIFKKHSRNKNNISNCEVKYLDNFNLDVYFRNNGYYEINSLTTKVIKSKMELDEIYENLPIISSKRNFISRKTANIILSYFGFSENYECIVVRCENNTLKLIKL